MSDVVDAGAPAPSDGHSAPVDNTPAPAPTPLGNQAPTPEKTDDKPEAPAHSKSAREALEKAFAAQESKGKETPAKPADAAPKPSDGPSRGEDGKFAAKEGAKPAEGEAKPAEAAKPAPRIEAPHRYSTEAKTAWDATPDAVKAETHRALSEMEKGIEKYRNDAQAYESVRQFDEQARQSGRQLAEVLNDYTGMERLLRENPVAGFERVAQNLGINFRDLAAHVLNQTPDQQQSRSEQTVLELRRELADLRQQMTGVNSHITQQHQNSITSQVDAFARENPRFDELSDSIAHMLKTGFATDLADAYSKADRLNPVPQPMTPPAPAAPAPVSLNPAGTRTVTGAPSNGSDPSPRAQASSTSRQALERAFAANGLRV
jgi:hypothetical protein